MCIYIYICTHYDHYHVCAISINIMIIIDRVSGGLWVMFVDDGYGYEQASMDWQK